MKIVKNCCYGGFSPSARAYKEYFKKKGKPIFFYDQTGYKHNGNEEYTRRTTEDISGGTFHMVSKDFGKKIKKLPNKYYVYRDQDKLRIDKDFIKVVEELGKKASAEVSNLQVIEIPDDIEWEVSEYDGIETIEEKHNKWWLRVNEFLTDKKCSICNDNLQPDLEEKAKTCATCALKMIIKLEQGE